MEASQGQHREQFAMKAQFPKGVFLMVSSSAAVMNVEADALDDVRHAVLALAERQTATLDAVAAHGVRLDALTGAVRGVEAQVSTSNRLLTGIATALESKGGGDFKELVDAVQGMAADVRELGTGTATMANAVTLLTQHLAVAKG